MRYVEAAMDKDISHKDERDLSVLQRLLRTNSGDPRIAIIMAFDLFLVGIDTVSDENIYVFYRQIKYNTCLLHWATNYVDFVHA